MLILYTSVLFLSAFLLFSVQPMVGRMVLPWLGGVPSVWTSCMLFFQIAVLAGYAYAHGSLGWMKPGRQRVCHLALLLLAVTFLPPGISGERVEALAGGATPVVWLLGTLVLTMGVPMVALSATTPTLLGWLSTTDHPDARDPHFLYAASNAGSIAALVAYPAVVEPSLGLASQARWWAYGYGILACLVGVCAWMARVRRSQDGEAGRAGSADESPSDRGVCLSAAIVEGEPQRGSLAVGRVQRWKWVIWAAVPSSLVLGVTQYITTDLASIPLFWVVPLGVYLATFIIAFSRVRAEVLVRWVDRAVPVTVAAVVFLLLSRAAEPLWLVLSLHLLGLLIGGLMCHGRLALERPGPSGITQFYLCLSLGGALGGAFNVGVAPWLFRSVAEYPLALVGLCLLRVRRSAGHPRAWALDLALPVLLGAVSAGMMFWGRWLGSESIAIRNAIGMGVPLVIAFAFAGRPLRFALALSMVMFTGWDYARPHGAVVRAERTFFGVTRVSTASSGEFHVLVHGNTLHGRQWLDPAKACEPLAYYHQDGPVRDLFGWLEVRRPGARVGVIGLGAGAMVCYSRPGDDWVFFEIDPAVIRVARDTNCFTYLTRCSAGTVRIVEGDARLQLRDLAPKSLDLLAVDAFSSDAIPVHLLTREALGLYQSRLRDGGLVAFHVSNRYVQLAPVVAELAADAGSVCKSWDDWNQRSEQARPGWEASEWVVVARQERDLRSLTRLTRWVPVSRSPGGRVWTDDYANLWAAMTGDR